MKAYKYLFLPMIFFVTSCYIYRPYTEKEEEEKISKPVEGSIRAKTLLDGSDKPGTPVSKQKAEKEKQKNMSSEESGAQERKQKEKEEQRQNQEQGPNKEQTQNKEQNQNSLSNLDGSVSANPKSNQSVKGGELVVTEKGIKGKLQPNKYFKIMALGKQYKIQVDKWEGDTLISHKLRQPKKQYKFHMNDIEEETILERRFSKPISDVLTVGAYVAGGAAVLLLVL